MVTKISVAKYSLLLYHLAFKSNLASIIEMIRAAPCCYDKQVSLKMMICSFLLYLISTLTLACVSPTQALLPLFV